jgi:hypothetical protein
MTSMVDRRSYATVTAAYLGFTLTDGALRMIVLFHFFALGFTPLQIAGLFVLYELCGMATNLAGGYIAARYGLALTLNAGLALQVVALLLLAQLPPDLSLWPAIAWVVGAQALSGIAKDLTKTSSKSAIKLVVPAGAEGQLYSWVSRLTGSKNALKGAGFFLGGALLSALGFAPALYALAGGLAIVLCGSLLSRLPSGMGRSKSKLKAAHLFSKTTAINWLSAARFFLFGARDVWFVVGLPLFLYAQGWAFASVGGFLAAWTIAYGIVQALAPAFVGRNGTADGRTAALWAGLLALTPLGLALALSGNAPASLSVVVGLSLFGLVFAVNSAVHSYLIVSYADADTVTLDVGFYYSANAAGRLVGTVLSGLMFQIHGFIGCLIAATIMAAMAALLALPLPIGRLTPGTVTAVDSE